MLDLNSDVDVVQAIAPQVRATDGALNGTTIELDGYNSCVVIFSVGTVTDGTYTPKVEESIDGGSTWTDVAASDLEGDTLVAVSTANDPKVQKVGYMGTRGVIRPVITSASTTSGGPVSATVIVGHRNQTGGSAIIS